MHRLAVPVLVAAGCGSSPPPAAATSAEVAPPQVVAPEPPPDAAVDAGVPDELANAPAWIFRFNAPPRVETWTLRHHGGLALVVVEAASGTTRYFGTATEGKTLALSVAAGSNTLTLDCQRKQQSIGTKCNDTKAKPMDVLDCYHPDFKSPMTFGPSPGVEYTTAGCTGYRMVQP